MTFYKNSFAAEFAVVVSVCTFYLVVISVFIIAEDDRIGYFMYSWRLFHVIGASLVLCFIVYGLSGSVFLYRSSLALYVLVEC